MTEDSARKVKELGGLTPTEVEGVSHAMIGKRGEIESWIQVVSRPGSLASTLTNPAALASIGTLMAQQQLQHSIDELREYLERIDEKVDDIRRAQTDAVVADMVGVAVLVDEAMTVRAEVGGVGEVSWSKVQAGAATIARTQAYALRRLDALASRLESTSEMSDLIRATRESEAEVQEWLGVIARCFQLQESLGVLELDRVLQTAPDELDRHRLGLRSARRQRLDAIARATGGLIDRMNAASSTANAKVLLNPFESPKVVRASNQVVLTVVDFQERVGIEPSRSGQDARRWATAVVESRDQAVASTLRTVDAARRLGAGGREKTGAATAKVLDTGAEGVARASEATGRLLNGLAERARRNRGGDDSPADG